MLRLFNTWAYGNNKPVIDGYELIQFKPNEAIYVPQYVAKNVYVDPKGNVRPHKFDKTGVWYFDGQFYYQRKQR